MHYSTSSVLLWLAACALTGCSFGADFGGYTADSGGNGDTDDASGPDAPDTPTDAAPDLGDATGPDTADRDDVAPAETGVDVPDTPDTPDISDGPDTSDSRDASDAPPDCAAVCAVVHGATAVSCDPECTYACERPWVDVDGDLQLGEHGDGCECRQTNQTELCSDDIDNDCNGIVNDGCCDESGWLTLAQSTESMARPAVAMHPNGAVLIAWEATSVDGPVVRAALLGARFQRVALDPITPTDGASYPSALVSGDRFVLAWLEGQPEPGLKTLWTRIYSVQGQPGAAAAFSPSTTNVPIEQATVVSANANTLAATWTQRACSGLEEPVEQCVQLEVQGVAEARLDDADPAARLTRGRLAVHHEPPSIATVWVEEEDSRNLKFNVSNTSPFMEVFSDELQMTSATLDSDPDVIALTYGRYLSAGYDNDSEALVVQLLDPDLPTRTVFADTTARDPRFASNGARTDVSVIWRDRGRLLHTTVSEAITASLNFRLLWRTEAVEAHDVGSDGQGRFAVAAIAGDRVVLGIFDANGASYCP